MTELPVREPPPAAPAPEPGRSAPTWVIVAFLLGGALLLGLAVAGLLLSTDDGERTSSEWNGTMLPAAPQRPDAVLVDTEGLPFDLRSSTTGKLTILFFGYTSCPDACPMQMATLSAALDRMSIPVEVLFVTTDPERDSPEVIRSWLDSFDRDFIGLTGEPDVLDGLQTDMQVSVALRDAADERGDYLVGHYTGAFLITPDDRAHLVYGFGTRQQDWLEDLPKVLEQEPWMTGGPTT